MQRAIEAAGVHLVFGDDGELLASPGAMPTVSDLIPVAAVLALSVPIPS
jgi:hypothetical protein